MRFSSSEKFCAGILAAVFAFSACTPKVAPERRLPAPKIMGGIPQAALPSPDRTGPWLQDLYEPSSGTTACQWLESVSRDTLREIRFQLIDNVRATKKKVEKSAGVHYLFNVSGMIDLGGSPLYSYALLSQTIPSKNEFLGLVDQEIEDSEGFSFKLHLGRFLMKLGILNAYTQRNKIIEERINDALPGIFASSETARFTIKKDSIPWVILKSGARELDDSALIQVETASSRRDRTDTDTDAEEKAEIQAEAIRTRYQVVLDHYKKSVPVFSESTWRSLSDEMRVSLSVAIRAFKTSDPVEKTCATTILHRILSQLFMIIGYDRLPFEQRGKRGFHLPTVDSLLESKQGTRYMVCPTAGSFVRDGRRVIIDRDVLTSFNSEESPLFDLTAGPQPLRICERRDAVPYTLDLHHGFYGEEAGEVASGSSWLALINALANFIAAFTPSSPWWQESTIGFPMAAFESLERIKSSGAVLPSDANALSLGLLNVSIATFLKKHLVFLDERNRVVTDAAQASKIRISETALETGKSVDRLETRLESAVLLGETAFKLGEALKTLAALKSGAEADLKSELDRIREISPDTPQAEQLKKRLMAQYQLNYREFLNFVESMYATRENLNDLTATGPESMREQIESLKLASALLLAEFAYPDGSGHYGCFNVLETDLSSGEERKLDTCSEPDKRLWKYALGLVAKEFRSPQFALLAE